MRELNNIVIIFEGIAIAMSENVNGKNDLYFILTDKI